MIGWLKKWWESRARYEQGNGTQWIHHLLEALGGVKSSSGIAINEDKAMSIAAVFTAVKIISGEVGALPIHVFRRTDDGGREIASKHWSFPLLHDSPNEYHTSMTWRELIVVHLLLWGNSYNRIEWLGNGSAAALYPLMPWDVEPRLTSKGVKFYLVRLPDGKEELPDDEMAHVPGLSYDGLRGLSVVGKMRDTLGEAKAHEEFSGAFFANGAKLGGILEVPGRMKEEAQKRLVDSLTEKFASREGAFKALVLEEGAKWHGPTTMPLKDAQFLEGRKFKRSEIFGWYGLPPHLGGDTERQTSWGTGIEQMDIGFAKHTINPLCVRIEQELNRKLFVRGSGYYCKHNLDALMRGDFKTRMEGLQIAAGRPWMSVNEVREILDMNRRPEAGYNDIALPLNTGTGAKPPEPDTGATPNDDEDDMRNITVNVAPPAVNFGESPEERSRREAVEQARVAATEAAMRDLAASSRDLAAAMRAAPATVVNVENRVPESPRPIVNVAPEVRNEVRVDVPPAEVNVHLPARKSVSVVERVGGNQPGDIERITQTERDD